MADPNFLFGEFKASSSSSFSFSSGTVDVKSKPWTWKRKAVKSKRNSSHSPGATTKVSSAATQESSNCTVVWTFSYPASSISPSTAGAFRNGETTISSAGFPPSSLFGPATTTSLHVFSSGTTVSSSVTNEKMVESVSTEQAENASEDTEPNLLSFQKENQEASPVEESIEPASCPPLQLVLISRILKGIPHSPHFLQLRGYSEMARKNLMVGWDRTFEETVDEIHSLTANHFRLRARKLCETVEELQNLGYNVLPLWKRLVELTNVTEEQKMSKSEIWRLRSKAEAHRLEKSRLESIILGLQQRAQREQPAIVETLKEEAKKENDLPRFDDVFAVLARRPL